MVATEPVMEGIKLPGPEKRRAPRVAMGRRGRIEFLHDDTSVMLMVNIIDLSLTGCRLIFEREALPSPNALALGTSCRVSVEIAPNEEISIQAEVAWSQRYRKGLNLTGLKFDDPEKHVTDRVDRFVMGRMRAGLSTEKPPSQTSARWKKLEELEQPLAVEAVRHDTEDVPPYRLQLLALGQYRLLLTPDLKKGEPPPPPPRGLMLEVSVYPPAWAGVELRSLRFAARVVQAEEKELILEFANEGHDLSQMIRYLLPDRKPEEKGTREINLAYVIIAIGVLLIYLLLAMT